MIKFIAFAAFALALATSAQAMPRVPLHQPDGMTTQVRYYGYGHRRYGYAAIGTTAIGTMAIGTTATAAIGTTGTGHTATGPTAMELPVESPAAISAEESSGSETPSTEPGRFGNANVSGSVRLVVTETDTTGRALQLSSLLQHIPPRRSYIEEMRDVRHSKVR